VFREPQRNGKIRKKHVFRGTKYRILLFTALLERWPQVCRVKITIKKLPTNRFVSTTKKSMKYVVNWIPLRICVRSRNTQPHLNFRIVLKFYCNVKPVTRPFFEVENRMIFPKEKFLRKFSPSHLSFLHVHWIGRAATRRTAPKLPRECPDDARQLRCGAPCRSAPNPPLQSLVSLYFSQTFEPFCLKNKPGKQSPCSNFGNFSFVS